MHCLLSRHRSLQCLPAPLTRSGRDDLITTTSPFPPHQRRSASCGRLSPAGGLCSCPQHARAPGARDHSGSAPAGARPPWSAPLPSWGPQPAGPVAVGPSSPLVRRREGPRTPRLSSSVEGSSRECRRSPSSPSCRPWTRGRCRWGCYGTCAPRTPPRNPCACEVAPQDSCTRQQLSMTRQRKGEPWPLTAAPDIAGSPRSVHGLPAPRLRPPRPPPPRTPCRSGAAVTKHGGSSWRWWTRWVLNPRAYWPMEWLHMACKHSRAPPLRMPCMRACHGMAA